MYAIICFDRPDSARLRDAHRAAHVQFLNAPSTGALIVVNCSTREEAEILIGADPFYVGGVYESVSIRAFKQVFPAPRP